MNCAIVYLKGPNHLGNPTSYWINCKKFPFLGHCVLYLKCKYLLSKNYSWLYWIVLLFLLSIGGRYSHFDEYFEMLISRKKNNCIHTQKSRLELSCKIATVSPSAFLGEICGIATDGKISQSSPKSSTWN